MENINKIILEWQAAGMAFILIITLNIDENEL